MKLLCLPLLLLILPLQAQYLRVVERPGGFRELQVASRELRLEAHPGVTVELLGVSHIGSKRYYESIQERLEAADVVLYEGIDGDRPEFREGKVDQEEGNNANLQKNLATALGLAFQLDAIDYNQEHFKNSDLSAFELFALFQGENPDGLDEAGRKRLEQLMQQMQGQGMGAVVMQNLLQQVQQHPRWRRALRWSLAGILGAVQGDVSEYAGLPEDMRQLMHVLIDRRNEVVLKDLAALLAKADPEGEQRILLFYGAAHMMDIEAQLSKQYGVSEAEATWLPAFRGSVERSGLGRLEKMSLTFFTEQQIQTLRLVSGQAGRPAAESTAESEE